MDKAIIFTEFAQMARILHREIPDSLLIDGATSTEERLRVVEEFNNNPKKNILIGTRAISFGLNLQAAQYIIHYDLPFSVSAYEQRSARAHRMGQKSTVYEYSLVAEDTVDEFVQKKLAKKQDILETLLPITELREILT